MKIDYLLLCIQILTASLPKRFINWTRRHKSRQRENDFAAEASAKALQ